MKKAKFIFCTLTLAAIGLSGCGTQVHTHNLVLHDAVAATCTVDGSVKYWSCDGCKKNFSDAEGKTEITDITVKATGHKYDGQTPSYTWKSDYTECKAEVKCKNCEHKESETASGSKITFTTVSQASCTAKEVRDYKATFTNALFTAQEKKGIEYGELAAHVYDNQERSYVWNSDNTECAAEVKCKNCEHKETEKVSSVATKISDASCTAKAKYKYEATFTNALFAKQVKDNVEVGELAAHVYENQERSYVWNNDHTECAAEVQCKNCTHKETETASGAKIVDTKTADKTCTTPEIHKYEASFDNALFTKQTVENVEVGDPAGHDVVTHAAKDPIKTEAGLSTTYYTCNHESSKYFSDNQCTTEISADDVAGYAIKSFDDLDAMLGGATGDNAYDYAKITAAYNYLDGKYSATAKTSYGNGAVLAAKAKYESLYTGPELEVGSKGYYDMYGSRLLNGGDDSTKKYITWKGDFEDTEYGKAYSFKVSSDYEDTDWAGARFSPFNTSADTYVNVFYFYSIGNAKIGLANWDANPFITWDVVEGWNEIVIPNDKVATAHTANQFRLVVKGLKQTNSYYKFTSVFGVKAVKYVIDNVDKLASMELYKALPLAENLDTVYNTLTVEEKAMVDYTKITAITNKNYVLMKANIWGGCDGKGNFNRITHSELGQAYEISNISASSSDCLFRLNFIDDGTKAAGVNTDSAAANDTIVFYTIGATFSDAQDDSIILKKHNGSDFVVGKITHKTMSNGVVKHTIDSGRSATLIDYLKTAPAGTVYLRFYFKNLTQGSTLYISSFFGVHA